MIKLPHTQKKLRYSVLSESGKELRKFYTLKVAIAFALAKEAIILTTYKYTEFRKKYPNATAAEFCTQTDFIEK
jgi:hypothetical protein